MFSCQKFKEQSEKLRSIANNFELTLELFKNKEINRKDFRFIKRKVAQELDDFHYKYCWTKKQIIDWLTDLADDEVWLKNKGRFYKNKQDYIRKMIGNFYKEQGSCWWSFGGFLGLGKDKNLFQLPAGLIEVLGDLDLHDSNIENLGSLQNVSKRMNLIGSKIKSLDNLKYVGKGLDLDETDLKTAPQDLVVSGSVYARKNQIELIGSLNELYKKGQISGIKDWTTGEILHSD